MMRLKDKATLVTGAASGNGRAMARGFAREGAWVAIVDRNGEGAREVAGEITRAGGKALAFTGDVADPASVESVVQSVAHEWGRLDVLVNNAGVGTIFPFLDTDPREWDHILDINLRGVLLYTYHGGRLMRESGGGSIINITSQLAEIGIPERSVYCASKGGVKMFTKCLALDLAKFKIRVNAIGPGVIRTAMSEARLRIPERLAYYESRVPMGRVGEPEDLVGAAVYLASEESAYVTGISLYVDGGFLAQ
jgi:NAD(P)-dependent dehydrogenase (short-subunit alcohol dehydrogenase family)